MIKLVQGDMVKSQVQTLVNTVNCVGVMGKGLALQFKKMFPEMCCDYQERCNRHEVKPGQPYIYKGLMSPNIINFPTKDHWRSVSRLQDIENGMEYLVNHYKEWGIKSIAMPPLGCGNGQLEWKVVGPIIYYYLKKMDIEVELYAPDNTLTINDLEQLAEKYGTNKKQNQEGPRENNGQRLKLGWMILIEILYRLEQQPYHYPVGRTVFQKIAFVATREGIPTGLSYQKSSYGPFCPELKELETILVNKKLLGESTIGKMLKIQVGSSYANIREDLLDHYNKWNSIIDRVVDLFMRVDLGQAEILATVLFSADQLNNNDVKPREVDVLNAVMEWKQRRRPPLKENDVAISIRSLAAMSWMKVVPSPDLLEYEDQYI